MTDPKTSPSEAIGFEEIEGRLHVRLRSGTIAVIDEAGQPVVVSDPSMRRLLFSGLMESLSKQPYVGESWNPWRQGP
jgi:hypothetical protein